MEMLKLINLFMLEKIFENADTKVSSLSKMVYINCLIHHFKDKEATVSNNYAFELLSSDFEYDKFKKNFHELHKAGIVSLNGDVITFSNVWGKYIEKADLAKQSEKDYSGAHKSYSVKHFEKTLKASELMVDLCCMKFKLTKAQIPALIDLFVLEQSTHEKNYPNEGECIKHCTNWIGKNLNKAGQKENVKSKGKLLGK